MLNSNLLTRENLIMPSTLTLSIITLVIIGSFVVSAISYSRQQALKKRKQLVRQLQLKAEEALSYQQLLVSIDKGFQLITPIQQMIVHDLSKAHKLTPNDSMLAHNLKIQEEKLSQFKQNIRENQIVRWANSDNELAQIQGQLVQVEKLLDLSRNRGEINIATNQFLHAHLSMLKLEISANSYLFQADHFAEQQNLTSYQLYIKQAIQVIKKSNIDARQKNTRIKELSDRITTALSAGSTKQHINFIKPQEVNEISETE